MPFDLPLPDPRRAQEALREVRKAVRAGFGLMRETIDRAPLPTPIAAVAGTVLRRVDDLAHQADATASTVVHGFLAAAGIEIDARAPRRVERLTAALSGALAELGASERRVSEAGVRAALAAGDEDPQDAPAQAAALMQRLLAAQAVRATAPATLDPAVPIFAAVLVDLQGPPADRAGIAASAALADALAGEIAAAGADRAALARLFAEFRHHV
jgi:hypothetical protein